MEKINENSNNFIENFRILGIWDQQKEIVESSVFSLQNPQPVIAHLWSVQRSNEFDNEFRLWEVGIGRALCVSGDINQNHF